MADPMCTCGLEVETTVRYLLSFNLYSIQRLEIFNNVCNLNPFLKINPMRSFEIFFYIDQKILIVIWTRKCWRLRLNFQKNLNALMASYLTIHKNVRPCSIYFLYVFFFLLDMCAKLILSDTWLSVSFEFCLVLHDTSCNVSNLMPWHL